MQVVAASVHHLHLDSRIVGGARVAGVRQAGLFLDRQRVEIRADQNSGAGTVAKHSNYTVGPNLGGNLQAELAQFTGEFARRLLFVIRKFGMRVEIFVELFQGGVFSLQSRLHALINWSGDGQPVNRRQQAEAGRWPKAK